MIQTRLPKRKKPAHNCTVQSSTCTCRAAKLFCCLLGDLLTLSSQFREIVLFYWKIINIDINILLAVINLMVVNINNLTRLPILLHPVRRPVEDTDWYRLHHLLLLQESSSFSQVALNCIFCSLFASTIWQSYSTCCRRVLCSVISCLSNGADKCLHMDILALQFVVGTVGCWS